ncbi:MAG TPA: hypothetical protein DD626_02465 [Clostridiales bacterium]|nr:hypothetical protein [Clostridiales bacterium]
MKRNRKKISRQEAVYRVALAGISAAVALLMVWLGVVVRFSTVAFFIGAAVALMVPLSQKYYLSSVLAYVVSAGLSFLVAGDVFSVMGYVVYFGPMAIISGVMLNHKDKIKWWVQLIVKIVYINGALALLYFVCHNIVLDSSIVDKVQYWMIALFGTVILVAIDYALQFIYKRIAILVGKALRKNERHRKSESDTTDSDDFDEETRPDGDSPFDEFSDDYSRDNNENNDENGNKGDKNGDCDNENGGANDK